MKTHAQAFDVRMPPVRVITPAALVVIFGQRRFSTQPTAMTIHRKNAGGAE